MYGVEEFRLLFQSSTSLKENCICCAPKSHFFWTRADDNDCFPLISLLIFNSPRKKSYWMFTKFECVWMWKDNAFVWPVGVVANSSMFEADSRYQRNLYRYCSKHWKLKIVYIAEIVQGFITRRRSFKLNHILLLIICANLLFHRNSRNYPPFQCVYWVIFWLTVGHSAKKKSNINTNFFSLQ